MRRGPLTRITGESSGSSSRTAGPSPRRSAVAIASLSSFSHRSFKRASSAPRNCRRRRATREGSDRPVTPDRFPISDFRFPISAPPDIICPRPLCYLLRVRVCLLASGSGGNACVVESGRTRVLVDAGLSAKEIEKRLCARGVAPETIAAIFLTHEHGDHSIGALTFAARFGCSIFATAGTAAALGLEGNLFSPFVRMESCREGRVGDIGFRPLATPHDSNESVAYAFEADDARMVVASDLGHVQREFLDFLRGAT